MKPCIAVPQSCGIEQSDLASVGTALRSTLLCTRTSLFSVELDNPKGRPGPDSCQAVEESANIAGVDFVRLLEPEDELCWRDLPFRLAPRHSVVGLQALKLCCSDLGRGVNNHLPEVLLANHAALCCTGSMRLLVACSHCWPLVIQKRVLIGNDFSRCSLEAHFLQAFSQSRDVLLVNDRHLHQPLHELDGHCHACCFRSRRVEVEHERFQVGGRHLL
mmetsp:Transcript_17408/g.67623  ORF Transcript_17408/g.67623 Transcript_17408/m.67623 type:complete len:218 (-) Transcript_17408:99-752(-)